MRELEVLQDGADHGRVGDEGEDPHMAATRGAEQRQHLVDASEQHSPSDASRAGGASWLSIGGGLLRWTQARSARELSGGCLGVGSADVGDGGTEFGDPLDLPHIGGRLSACVFSLPPRASGVRSFRCAGGAGE